MKNPARIIRQIVMGLSVLSLTAAAQPGISSNWYFGNNAAISFNSGSPVSISGSSMAANEGSASISDAAGNLLFYTDGTSVWDRNNNQMPNGFGLLGNSSSTQSAVICPAPGNPNLYYVFTADQGGYGGPNQGVYYNTVDMTLNGGLGDVVIRNSPLEAPLMTEKIVAVRHCNGSDFWIIVHKFNSNEFDAFLLTSAGINLTPVVSAVGTTETDLTPTDWAETIGYLKASPDGHRLGLGVYIEQNIAEVYDFDNSAGLITNPIVFTPNTSSTSSYDGEYGVSFSPDNSKFYVGWYGNPSYIYQYDLSLSTPAAIIASQTTVATVNTAFPVAALQLGPDGKIYVVEAGANYLDVINNPNVAGTGCNFQANAVPINFGTTANGLPNFVDAYVPGGGTLSLGPDVTVCDTSYTITTTATGSHLWNTGDTTSSITVHTSGTYWVTVQSSACSGAISDTINVTFGVSQTENIGPDTTTCASSVLLSSSTTGPWLWSTGATTSSITVTSNGTYWVTSGSGNCTSSDTVNVSFINPQSVNLGPDIISCSNSATINCNVSGSQYLWNTGATTQSISVTQSGDYYVTAGNGNCSASDTIHVTLYQPVTASLGPDIISCDSVATLTYGAVGGHYEWNTGDTTQSIIATQAGAYWVTFSNGPCTSSDTIQLDFMTAGLFTAPNVFTPNADHVNDVLEFGNPPSTGFYIQIFDRWGVELFETSDPAVMWDGKHKGKEAPDGVYYWVAKYEDCNGNPDVRTGFVELIR